MASRRYAFAARLPAAGWYQITLSAGTRRRWLAPVRTALSWAPFVLLLWIGLSVLLARGEALPGVYVGAVPVGGMDRAEARAAVDLHYAHALAQPIQLVVDGRTWTPTPAELGYAIQPEGAIDRAMTYGRDREQLNGVLRAMGMPEHTVAMPVAVAIDDDALDSWLDRIETELGGGPIDAAVTIDGDRIEIIEAAPGLGIDRDALRQAIADQLVASRSIAVDVTRSAKDPSIPTSDAVAAKAAVETLVAEPLVLVADDESWELEPVTMLAMVDVVPDAGALYLRVDSAAIDATVDQVAGELERSGRAAVIEDHGSHKKLVPSIDGRSVDRGVLAQAIHGALGSDQREIIVPFTYIEPSVTTEHLMAELGITGLIASGDSVYTGSGSGRAHNVEQAVRKIDGTLVAPGGTFSFNDAVGSLFSGEYLDAGSYIDGPNGQSLAGGVCQVSTTVYRAALLAGFPITEWWPHSYRSPFYELGGWSPGWDASIMQDGNNPAASTDFRFVNPTDSWLLIRSSVTSDDVLTVEIHGAPTGYDVWFDEPEIETIAWATDAVTVTVDHELPSGTILPDQPKMDGLRVKVVRYVADADGDMVSVDPFVSTYGAYGAIRRVSPDMEAAAWSQ